MPGDFGSFDPKEHWVELGRQGQAFGLGGDCSPRPARGMLEINLSPPPAGENSRFFLSSQLAPLSLCPFPSSALSANRWVAPTVLRMSEVAEPEATAEPTEAPAAPAEKLSLDALEIDSELEGTVKGVSDFGAFVDFGADTDGLVHKSQLSDSFVENPSEFVKVGDTVHPPSPISMFPVVHA